MPKPPKPFKEPKDPKIPGGAATKGRPPNDVLTFLVETKICKKLMPATLSDLKGNCNIIGQA